MHFDKNHLHSISFNKKALHKSYEWLTDPEIKHLTDTPSITKEGQLSWFESLAFNQKYIVKVVCYDEEMIGVFGLKNIDTNESCVEYFGYIGNKNFWGMGVGNWMVDKAFEIAREQKLLTISLKVITENFRAINLYFKKGFKIMVHENGYYKMQRSIV